MKNLGNTLNEIQSGDVHKDIYHYLVDIADQYNESELNTPVEDMFGGGFWLCEKPEDLKNVFTATEGPDGRWLSLVETADSFDVCRWLDGGNFVAILLCTSNDGGTTYFIPKYLVTQNVLDSIEMTRKAWDVNNS
jgi:hypothetical protein